MKKTAWVLAIVVWSLHVGGVHADDVRIGYVDVRKVLTESKAGQKVKAEIEKLVKQHKGTLGSEEQKLKGMQQDFEKNKLLLSETQREAKQQEFQERVRAFQKARSEAQRDIDQREREYTGKALPQIRAIIRDVAKEMKLTLVFEKNESPVLYAADGPDLTDKIIERFNAKGGN